MDKIIVNDTVAKVIIILPIILGFSVGFFTKPDNWYANLNKAPINVPSITFSIVWSILYIFIGIAYYLALKNKSITYWVFPIIHLMFNLSYTPILFVYHKILLSCIVIIIVLLSAIYLAYLFYYYDKTGYAYILLIPYILWLCFANYLAWSLYFLN
jgi:tryptophan-rich sensory protein